MPLSYYCTVITLIGNYNNMCYTIINILVIKYGRNVLFIIFLKAENTIE